MNILLVNPPQGGTYGTFRPPVQMHMGLAYLAAMVAGEQVRILDWDAEQCDDGSFARTVEEGDFAIAGFTVVTTSFHPAVRLAKEIKSRRPRTVVVFGGMHPTVMPDETLASGAVDIVVKGEGEQTFKEITECVKKGGDLSRIAGIAYKEGQAVRETPPRALLPDLDALPFPARHLFRNHDYTYPDSLYKETAPIITSRGCPGRCSFCGSHRIWQRLFRARSAANVADEIERLVKSSGVREIHIWDDNFATDRKRVFAIRDEIRRRGVKVAFAFPNGIRADCLDREVLSALKEMGTYSVAIGVESGSQEMLNACHKGVRLERIREIFSLLKEMKIETWAFFMIGFFGETAETIRQDIRFAKELDPDFVKFHILKPLPGSEAYERMRSNGWMLTQDYAQYGFHTPPIHRLKDLDPAAMMDWQRTAYRSFYLRLRKIAQQITRLRTANRCLLNFRAALGMLRMMS